jgi:hypothetical protein
VLSAIFKIFKRERERENNQTQPIEINHHDPLGRHSRPFSNAVNQRYDQIARVTSGYYDRGKKEQGRGREGGKPGAHHDGEGRAPGAPAASGGGGGRGEAERHGEMEKSERRRLGFNRCALIGGLLLATSTVLNHRIVLLSQLFYNAIC